MLFFVLWIVKVKENLCLLLLLLLRNLPWVGGGMSLSTYRVSQVLEGRVQVSANTIASVNKH